MILGQVGFGSDFGFGTDLRCRPVKQTLFSDFGSVFFVLGHILGQF